jgi:hypothetical protein
MTRVWMLCCLGLLLASAGCGDFFLNQTASLGGSTAGDRGTVTAVFINNTPHRPVFTFGVYDNTDRTSQPEFRQFDLNGEDLILDGNSISDPVNFDCGRVFSVGGASLLEFVEENIRDPELVEEAFIEGIEFYREEDDPDTGDPVLIGTAPGMDPLLLGVDFPCNALLIFRFEFDDVSEEHEFRVEFELIPSESTR